jgi:hypothetical protein
MAKDEKEKWECAASGMAAHWPISGFVIFGVCVHNKIFDLVCETSRSFLLPRTHTRHGLFVIVNVAAFYLSQTAKPQNFLPARE